jgi:hypothetical protein
MKFHLALCVRALAPSIEDYSARLGKRPDVAIPHAYALWRTGSLNFSIREEPEKAGELRHLGFEDPGAPAFSRACDVNGVVWERFSAQQQQDEINNLWPDAAYEAKS